VSDVGERLDEFDDRTHLVEMHSLDAAGEARVLAPRHLCLHATGNPERPRNRTPFDDAALIGNIDP
jgi:hypothetical protein